MRMHARVHPGRTIRECLLRRPNRHEVCVVRAHSRVRERPCSRLPRTAVGEQPSTNDVLTCPRYVRSELVTGGKQDWKLTLYPKGCASMEYASLYVTNCACEMEDSPELKMVSIATVKATVTKDIEPKEKKQGPGDDGGDDTKSRRSGRSGASGSTRASTARSGAASSRRSRCLCPDLVTAASANECDLCH